MIFLNGVEYLSSPTIQGTVDPGTGLTMPAHTSGSITFNTVTAILRDVNDNFLFVRGSTSGYGYGAKLGLFGKDYGEPGKFTAYTPNAGGTGDVDRLSISGKVAIAVASWTNVTHTGLTLSGKLTGGDSEIEGSVFDINGGTIDGVTITAPVLDGTVTNTGATLTMPAHTSGVITYNGVVAALRDVNNSVAIFRGSTNSAGFGAYIGLYGKDYASSGQLILATPNLAKTGDSARLIFSGGIQIAVATWSAVTHTGLKLSGALNVNSNALQQVYLIYGRDASDLYIRGNTTSTYATERNIHLECLNAGADAWVTLMRLTPGGANPYTLVMKDMNLYAGAKIVNLKAGTTAIDAVVGNRGEFYFTEGAAGVADKLYCIMKGADNNYSAIQVAIG